MRAATTNTGRGAAVDCRYAHDERIAESYLNGQLAAAQQDEFEVHLLECRACVERVELLGELRAVLTDEASRIRVAPERNSARLWYWSFAAASLILVVMFGFPHLRKSAINTARSQAPPPQQASPPSAPQEQQPEPGPAIAAQPHNAIAKPSHKKRAQPQQPDLTAAAESPAPASAESASTAEVVPPSETVVAANSARTDKHGPNKPRELTSAEAVELYKLAEVHPAQYSFSGAGSGRLPPKRMTAVEGAGSQESATNAMVAYVDGNYRAAGNLLESAAQAKPNAPDINFYLGVCRLLLGRPDDAISPLTRVIEEGKSRYVQAAHVYLAKAYLQKADLKHAESELEAASSLPGQLKAEANSLLQRVRTLRTAVESTAPQ